MIDKHFKLIGQKVSDSKMILVAVVDTDFMNCGEIPSIFEMQCVNMSPTIYTGTYPNIRLNLESLKERSDLQGLGISGILTEEQWYCTNNEKEDLLGISIPSNNNKSKK